MPLDRLIDLLAEAAVRKLSQEREAKDATPDAMPTLYRRLRRWSQDFRNGWRYCWPPQPRRYILPFA
ncbi:hypothetical protein B6V75_00210 [Thioclava sp. F1Mire-8]|nr:hypothetical protein B6V75_00210 [Thioclava sp. F1Mire-8]